MCVRVCACVHVHLPPPPFSTPLALLPLTLLLLLIISLSASLRFSPHRCVLQQHPPEKERKSMFGTLSQKEQERKSNTTTCVPHGRKGVQAGVGWICVCVEEGGVDISKVRKSARSTGTGGEKTACERHRFLLRTRGDSCVRVFACVHPPCTDMQRRAQRASTDTHASACKRISVGQ